MIEKDDLAVVNQVFQVYETKENDPYIHLYGEPLVDSNVFYGKVYDHFRAKGKSVWVEQNLGEYVLTIAPAKKESVWINVVLAVATFLTTMLTGAMMYGVNPITNPLDVYQGLPFAIAIMVALGSHELGHYLVSKKYGIDATLPYFIPFPFSPIGTMGAIIRQKGPVPTRKALFDVGIAGPLAGLVVSVIIIIIGLMLPAPTIDPSSGTYMQLNTPLLFDFLAWIVHPGETLTSINPIAFAGWVGLLVTVLNMIPVGQLDGGHISRAVFGERANLISRVMPAIIMAFGLYGTFILHQPGEIWILWGFLSALMSAGSHPKPTDDKQTIGMPRYILAAATFVLTLLCFTPFPITM
ncbi:site-2 protease family protein [Methanocella sp. MCL-LM]|uniref:site-2 protease family protein n=1 Tax=Methanocella sp. MCL-LM TaxID=3412035 RepID=UPI003C713D67